MPIASAASSSSRIEIKRAANVGMHDVVDDDDGDDRKAANPEEVCVRGIIRRPSHGGTRPRKPVAPPTAIDVQNDDADDLSEAQRDDRQIIAAQTQDGNSDYQPSQGGDQRAKNNTPRKTSACASVAPTSLSAIAPAACA